MSDVSQQRTESMIENSEDEGSSFREEAQPARSRARDGRRSRSDRRPTANDGGDRSIHHHRSVSEHESDGSRILDPADDDEL